MRSFLVCFVALAPLLAGCSSVPPGELTGDIRVDGSSTVYLITEAMASEFKKQHPYVHINVGISGTGGGFKKFAAGETDISDASRKIKRDEEENCKKHGIEPLEFQVAWDGLTVVIHPDNYWAREMSIEQLREIWRDGSTVTKWSDVDPSWPDAEIKLFGAGPESGTFDYFTEAVNGKEKNSRKDYAANEDDNVTARGIAGNLYALGYFGLAYYEENKDIVRAVAIKGKGAKKAVPPDRVTVLDRTYPLSRPLFIYVKKASLSQRPLQEFVRFYLRRGDLVREARYIELTTRDRVRQQDILEREVAKLK